jgi:RNA recognition motif-containing protein
MATPPSARLYVSGLHAEISDTDLIVLFSKYGPQNATVKRWRDSGVSRGFGFVQFASQEAATEARNALDQFRYMGNTLRVTYADPSIEFQSGRRLHGARPPRPPRELRLPRREREADAESDVLLHEPPDPLARSCSRSSTRSPSPLPRQQMAVCSGAAAGAACGTFYLMMAIDPTKNTDIKTLCGDLLRQFATQEENV